MEAIEFQTTLGIDGVIAIPESLGKKVRRGKVRVIVIEEDIKPFNREETHDRELDRTYNYINYLMANPFEVDKTKPMLTRDELYERTP